MNIFLNDQKLFTVKRHHNLNLLRRGIQYTNVSSFHMQQISLFDDKNLQIMSVWKRLS